jgi:hypothetical protein
VFDDLADHCVLLSMAGRLPRAIDRVRKDMPHSCVTVQLNPGMDGKVDLMERSTRADICHALAAAFLKAYEQGWKRLLVLEDDFFLGDLDGARRASKDIARFLDGRTFDTYNLGRLVFVGWPSGEGSWRALAHGTAHGVLYTERFMRAYLEKHADAPWEIYRVGNDLWWNRAGMIHYVYDRALVFQTFPRTENRETFWNDALKSFAIWLLDLETSHEPGYAVLNAVSKAALPTLVAAALFVILFIFNSMMRFHPDRDNRSPSAT